MRRISALLIFSLVCGGAGSVLAEAPHLVPGDAGPLPAAPPTEDALSPDQLADVSGLGVENTLLSEQQLNAASSGNSITANTVRSGDISMAGALTNFTGVGNFVVNTGNNNTLQGAISVNIITTPGQ